MLAIASAIICILPTILAHNDEFVFDQFSAPRFGEATLKIKPDAKEKKTYYEFTTRQQSVYDRSNFRVAFQFLRNLTDN